MILLYNTDILIIGAGAVGTAIARAFSQYNIRTMVVDKNDDVGGDATKACSAIAGTGYGNAPGSLVARLSHDSYRSIDRLIDELDIHANRCGQIMPAFREDEVAVLHQRVENARKNGDEDVVILTKEEALKREPILNPAVLAAIYSPREVVIDTFDLVYAQAENAAANGVTFLTSCEVKGICTENGRVTGAETTLGPISARYIINAAGLYCDEITRMVEEIDFTVHPRKGQFFILDKDTACKPKHIIMPVPTPHTRGKLVLPTAHGNVLAGPTAEDGTNKEDVSTTAEGLQDIERDLRELVPGIVLTDAITQFAGLRPARTPEGYFIGFSKKTEGFFAISGVRSDGVTTSVGIAHYVVSLFAEHGVVLERKTHFINTRKAIQRFAAHDTAQQHEMVQRKPLYGNIVCRCEAISEAEIIEAIRRVPGATSLDSIKRRLRAGMGRCQGGFCSPRIVDILARELNVSPTEVTKKGGNSRIAMTKNR